MFHEGVNIVYTTENIRFCVAIPFTMDAKIHFWKEGKMQNIPASLNTGREIEGDEESDSKGN